MALGEFPNLSLVYKVFHDVDSAYLWLQFPHKASAPAKLLEYIVIAQICYAKYMMPAKKKKKKKKDLFNKYLIVTSFLELC